MNFSKECQIFIDEHTCSKHEEAKAIHVLQKYLPIGASSIDWSRVKNKKTYSSVARSDLKKELLSILKSIKPQSAYDFFVIHMDDAVPALKTNIHEWLDFVSELDFADTLYLSVDNKIVIHWDFYKDLHTCILAEDSHL